MTILDMIEKINREIEDDEKEIRGSELFIRMSNISETSKTQHQMIIDQGKDRIQRKINLISALMYNGKA
jgi:hypothetical protein